MQTYQVGHRRENGHVPVTGTPITDSETGGKHKNKRDILIFTTG
jgi:hypothetical protein